MVQPCCAENQQLTAREDGAQLTSTLWSLTLGKDPPLPTGTTVCPRSRVGSRQR